MKGVIFKKLGTNQDDRGWLSEIYRQDEDGYLPAMGYVSVTHPGVSRGPHEHEHQTDCFVFLGPGDFELYLWDRRENSPTNGQHIKEVVGQSNPTMVIVPPGVVHGYKAIGHQDAWSINLPDKLYRGVNKVAEVDEIRWENDLNSPYQIPRKLLVTGGAGFIGSNFIHYWLKKHPQDQIINLDLLTYAGNLANLDSVANNPNYQFVQGDIADAVLVDQLVSQVDYIVNFAAETHVDRSIADGMLFVHTNIQGTANLLESARRHGGVRFHQISTDEVYGDLTRHDSPFTEQSIYQPSSPYSASKAAADHLVRAYYRTYKLPVTISNCSNNYGPYQFPEKIIPLFVTNLLDDIKVPLYGTGQNIRDWIHVDDHSAGIEAILLKGKIGETYCLGGDHEVSNIDLTKQILRLLGKDDSYIQPVADRLGHDWRYAIDFTKAQQELGWRPVKSFEEGLAETVQWYRDNPGWWRPLKK